MLALDGSRSSDRRADIDGLRVAALLLLILYHVLLIYSSWDWWRVKSAHAGQWADYFVAALVPWRMSLVFFIGGIAARFMFEKLGAPLFVRDRATKLLVAFVFAVIVLVPLQRYVRLDNTGGPHVNYFDYLTHFAPVAVSQSGVWMPDFGHAWFLPYLFVYSAAAVVLWRFAPSVFAAAQGAIERAPLALLVLTVMLWFAFLESIVSRAFPTTGFIFTDIGAHMKFAPVFLLGVLLGKSTTVRSKLLAMKGWLWLSAAILLAVSLGLEWDALRHGADLAHATAMMFVTRGLYGGAMLFGVLAFGEWVFTKGSAKLAYATDAILPVYLMHQTALVIAADALVAYRLPLALEFPLLLAAAGLVPLAIYQIAVRHTPLLRMAFGLRPHLRDREAPPPAMSPGAPTSASS